MDFNRTSSPKNVKMFLCFRCAFIDLVFPIIQEEYRFCKLKKLPSKIWLRFY